ncbi:BQ2448_3861 [Microbotryum intermedium]|uniref:BQ2448_3861 protein n=1 Tax=Microbotryum intermedium TaxID=269621 RepID=A0A238FKB0_9BASI|nr:BQ2448_3861 [Microbotryum intermedium]
MGKKDRPTARRTTAIKPRSTPASDVLTRFSPPSITSSTTAASSSSSTPTPTYYAHLHRAPDAHTLRIYDASNGKCISRWASDAVSTRSGDANGIDGDAETEEPQARHKIHAIEWAFIPSPQQAQNEKLEGTQDEGQGEKKRGKKRRKSDSQIEVASSVAQVNTVETSCKLVLVMGQESGEVLVWSPNGKEEWTLSHPSVNSPVTALASPTFASVDHLWSTHQDGIARVWDLSTRSLIARTTVLGDVVTQWDDLAVRYSTYAGSEESKTLVHLVLSKASLQVYSLALGLKSKKDKVKEVKSTLVGRCTGHVDLARIEWVAKADDSAMQVDDSATTQPDELAFFTYSETDRFVQLWSVPLSNTSTSGPKDGHLVARLGLDSGVQAIASNAAHLAAIDAKGKAYLASLPTTTSTTKKVQALKVETEVQGAAITNAFFASSSNQLVLCRAGVKPVFEHVEYLNESGSLVDQITLEKNAMGLFANGQEEAVGTAPPTRYVETNTSTSRSAEPTLATEGDEDDDLTHSGQLDVDMAEPTLADRLQSMNMYKAKQNKDVLALREDEDASSGDEEEGLTSDEDDDEDDDEEEDEADLSTRLAAPATTLTTTLIQALHSSDAPLLESCLLHDSPTLIRSTVQKLPSGSLVLNLLEALVQRLGTGKRRKGGVASVQRARGLVEWVRQVLIVHVGFLVTIPSLVTRLSALHASLTNRLSIQPTLFALHGRLDLVLAQIQSRQSRLQKKGVGKGVENEEAGKGGVRYVEGESSEEDDNDEEEVGEEEEGLSGEDDEEEDEGSVEDVMLGGNDDDEEGSEEDEDGSAGEGSGEEGGEGMEGLLDLEASEDDGEEDEDEDDDEDDEDEDESD